DSSLEPRAAERFVRRLRVRLGEQRAPKVAAREAVDVRAADRAGDGLRAVSLEECARRSVNGGISLCHRRERADEAGGLDVRIERIGAKALAVRRARALGASLDRAQRRDELRARGVELRGAVGSLRRFRTLLDRFGAELD